MDVVDDTDTAGTEMPGKILNPHAYHLNLPPHHMDKNGVPYITKFAEKKVRLVLELAHSIELTEELFVRPAQDSQEENYGDDDDEGDYGFPKQHNTMTSVMKKCTRLHSQYSNLAGLKYNGMSQMELCKMILHLMRLISATVTIESGSSCDSVDLDKHATLHFENVGYILEAGAPEQNYDVVKDPTQLEKELSWEFALPPPARESLLSLLITLLSHKGPLLSVSNAAIYPINETGNYNETNRFMLILHWRPLLRMMLRTAPYLDEHKVGTPPTCSNSKQITILRRTVHLVRHARHFFDQGIRPPSSTMTTSVRPDATARDLWEMVKSDLLYHTHTHSCFRGLILLYLFQPSRCTTQFYIEVMPQWMESWSNIDRCPEFDFLWLVLFCRARKHVTPLDYDWGPLRRRLLTQCQYWLQLPVGGGSSDKFPRAGTPRSRAFPSRLKSFVGVGSSYEEGIDFVAKVSKLLVTSIGVEDFDLAKAKVTTVAAVGGGNQKDRGTDKTPTLSRGTEDIMRFLSFVAPYFNPSNVGSWTFTLGAFLHYFSYELCHRIGIAASLEALKASKPLVAEELCRVECSQAFSAIPPHEIVTFLDALLPLCQQALYSKNGHVGRAGEASMVYLSQIDPVRVAPPFLDFATRALDYSAVNLAHQAPAALSAMTRIVQPALRREPSILLGRLPEILRLSLAGIDSNDQNKTIRTLIFYRNLTSWIPVGGCAENWVSVTGERNPDRGIEKRKDGTICLGENISEFLAQRTQSEAYMQALRRLPESSLLYQQECEDPPDTSLLIEEAASALSDWSLSFLDRIYALLSASGEREKTGKVGSGVASRHSSADVQQARNFSRVMKECMLQLFSAMDEETHRLAVRSVAQFLEEETLPFASKDASALCIAVAGARVVERDGQKVHVSPGLDALVPILTENLEQHSSKTVVYRLRCLSGAVRTAGRSVYEHRAEIKRSLDFALSSKDKHVFKTGCKLLRHTLASQAESYPLSSDCMPRSESLKSSDGDIILGKSSHLREDPLHWHVPDGGQVEFVCDLLNQYIMQEVEKKCVMGKSKTDMDFESLEMIDGGAPAKKCAHPQPSVQSNQQWRRILRVVRYALRGCSGLLLDVESEETSSANTRTSSSDEDVDLVPYEKAVYDLLGRTSSDRQASLMSMKGRILAFTVALLSVIASEAADGDAMVNNAPTEDIDGNEETDNEGKQTSLISSDIKVCKEVSDIALLLLTRRGASFRCQEAKTIWRAQKQLVTDYVLAAQRDYMAATLQRSAQYALEYGENSVILYKDGEDGGKTLPRRLVVSRMQLFYESIQRNASFEIPRRLRRQARCREGVRTNLFTIETNMSETMANLQNFSTSAYPSTLDAYEGLIDGLFALSCHSNTQVRSSGFGVIDYALTRFGWIVPPRVPRLLSAIQLNDEGMNGEYGIPSCAQLSKKIDSPKIRKRLAEVIKGVCSVVSVSRSIKILLDGESIRFDLAKTLCGTEGLIALLPAEEIQKMVYYFHGIFSPFRSRLFSLTRAAPKEQSAHEACLNYLMDHLSADSGKMQRDPTATDTPLGKVEDAMEREESAIDGNTAASSLHWRNRLLVAWFLTSFVDKSDLLLDDPTIANRLWSTCFQLLESEMGQPLQRVAVGLFGRLISFALPVEARLTISLDDCGCPRGEAASYAVNQRSINITSLCEKVKEENFCRVLGMAIAFDHKEDTSIGGGHQAQWSTGVEEIFRDATSNVAPKSLFPFQRTSRSSNTFKVPHAQLIESLLLLIGSECAEKASAHFLALAKEMANAPPSEDQRNQQCTSAEIFGGVCRALLQISRGSNQRHDLWESRLLPFLDDVIPKIPISLAGAFFDSLRYAIHFFPPSFFFDLTAWVTDKIEATLWQPVSSPQGKTQESEQADDSLEDSTSGSGPVGADGFTNQSKWLYLANALLVELYEETEIGVLCRLPWYSGMLLEQNDSIRTEKDSLDDDDDAKSSWKLVSGRLLPLLLGALGHPYESCREHIAACLFRISYCHRKMVKTSIALGRSNIGSNVEVSVTTDNDPGSIITKKLAALEIASDLNSFKERYNSLITARKFVAYCLHLGDAKHEYSDFIIPLLPLTFQALEVTVEKSDDRNEDDNKVNDSRNEDDSKIDAAKRALEADVVKGFRHSIADVSSSAVICYGKSEDISRVLEIVKKASNSEYWQVRHASAHFLRCFQGYHKFLFQKEHTVITTNTVASLLADERRDVSSAAMAALTGILAATPSTVVIDLVNKYVALANRSKIKRKKKFSGTTMESNIVEEEKAKKEKRRCRNQQTSVFFLCAAVLARPYDTPTYVPEALAAISKHSFEKNAPLGIRDVVKNCCAEFKRTHMSDNWEVHRKRFTQEQLEALEDVVSAPHYYA